MKVKLPSPSEFNIKDVTIAGDECVLVTPKDMGVAWTEENKYFRSSIWRKHDMHPVSLGFRKFTYIEEQPEFEPWDYRDNFQAVHKIDGSLLIVSKYKGQLIARTRGTIDASQLANGFEIEELKKKYPKCFDNEYLSTERFSLLFEWTTPTNRIVLKESNEPTLTLIGVVNHDDYGYIPPFTISNMLDVGAPMVYGYNELEHIKEFLKTNETIEGFVLYSSDWQTLKKAKTDHYLKLHRLYTGIRHVNQLYDVWKDYNYPSRKEFEERLAREHDHELVIGLEKFIAELFESYKELKEKYDEITSFVAGEEFRKLTRKEQAQIIASRYQTWAGIAFSCLDGKPLEIDNLFKLKKYEIHRIQRSASGS
jgi:hypothetical protein